MIYKIKTKEIIGEKETIVVNLAPETLCFNLIHRDGEVKHIFENSGGITTMNGLICATTFGECIQEAKRIGLNCNLKDLVRLWR